MWPIQLWGNRRRGIHQVQRNTLWHHLWEGKFFVFVVDFCLIIFSILSSLEFYAFFGFFWKWNIRDVKASQSTAIQTAIACHNTGFWVRTFANSLLWPMPRYTLCCSQWRANGTWRNHQNRRLHQLHLRGARHRARIPLHGGGLREQEGGQRLRHRGDC